MSDDDRPQVSFVVFGDCQAPASGKKWGHCVRNFTRQDAVDDAHERLRRVVVLVEPRPQSYVGLAGRASCRRAISSSHLPQHLLYGHLDGWWWCVSWWVDGSSEGRGGSGGSDVSPTLEMEGGRWGDGVTDLGVQLLHRCNGISGRDGGGGNGGAQSFHRALDGLET